MVYLLEGQKVERTAVLPEQRAQTVFLQQETTRKLGPRNNAMTYRHSSTSELCEPATLSRLFIVFVPSYHSRGSNGRR